MGRFVCLMCAPLIFVAVFFLTLFGGQVVFRREEKEELQHEAKEQEVIKEDPHLEHDDEDRNWLADLSPLKKLKRIRGWYGHQSAQVGALPQSVEDWHKEQLSRRATRK